MNLINFAFLKILKLNFLYLFLIKEKEILVYLKFSNHIRDHFALKISNQSLKLDQ